MKTRFPRILGVFAAIFMVASFVIPASIVAPAAVSADPGIMRWDTVLTPNSMPLKNDIDNNQIVSYAIPIPAPSGDIGPGLGAKARGSEIESMAVGNDGMTLAWIVRDYGYALTAFTPGYLNVLDWSNTSGIASPGTKELGLIRAPGFILVSTIGDPQVDPKLNGVPGNCYQVVMAPDDPKFIAVTCDGTTNGMTTALHGAGNGVNSGPKRIYVSSDSGNTWDQAFDGIALGATEYIRNLDISIDYGGKRDIGFVTVTGTGAGRWFVRASSGFNNWIDQAALPSIAIPSGLTTAGAVDASAKDYYALKFSPTYNGDSSVAIVFATMTGGTYYNVAQRDLSQNYTIGWAFGTSINVRNTAMTGDSPHVAQLNNVGLQLPSDFSGQSSSLRRAYISLDAYGNKPTYQDGIYRIDDTTVYVLMDNTQNPNKSMYSIAYFGTYASGKLLAGERMGFPCTATVPTWFTDSPTTCPIPCWYPALKATTGAAGLAANCVVGNNTGVGAALVGWNADGSLGLVSTGSLAATNALTATPATAASLLAGGQANSFTAAGAPSGAVVNFVVEASGGWWVPLVFGFVVPNDESAFAISRNNGETWNQLSLIDTTIDWFNDVAVAPDCTTIYLASVNGNRGVTGFIGCNEFDSVWRTTINPNVAAPLAAVPPLGTYWERVLARVTAGNCGLAQSELPILRVVESCTDKKDGEIVAWAAQNARATTAANSGGVMAWSPDFGDYWSTVTPRYPVQDFVFETSTTMYVVSADGVVQRLPYTGTSWSTNLPNYDTELLFAHTIAAVPDGKVLVGGAKHSPYPGAYSLDKAVTLNVMADPIPNHGNEHMIFDVDFANNQFFYMADDAAAATGLGTVYRNTVPSLGRWVDNDMMSAANGGGYVFALEPQLWWSATGINNPPHIIGQYGIVQAFTGDPQPALYVAHDNLTLYNSNGYADSAVCRTLRPRDGMPKPGMAWACLDVFAPLTQKGVLFTLEPTSLKSCGCCTLDTNTTLYAIDNEGVGQNSSGQAILTYGYWLGHLQYAIGVPPYDPNVYAKLGYTPDANQGMLWAYTDCLAKKGPVLKSPADQFLVGADPVTGRNSQIDLSWEQLCLTVWYQLQIAKDKDFTLRVNPSVNWGNGSTGVISSVTGSLLMKMDSTNNTSPAAWIPPGSLPEAGAIYYWRVRSAKSATSQIANSPWSEVRSFTVKAGFQTITPYLGVQLLSPNNGGIGIATKPTQFSWSPYQDATKYEFDLAKDSEFKQMVTTANTSTTAYSYSGALDYATSYFWRVKALEINGQNIPSDWSATFSFQTEGAPPVEKGPAPEPATPLWVWVIIAIGAILVIVTLILIFKTRRV